MKKISFLLTVLIATSAIYQEVRGQEAIAIFGRIYADPQNGPGYFEPLSNALNSGLSAQRLSHKPQTRPRLGLSIVGVKTFIPDKYRQFDAIYTSTVSGSEQSLEVPTVFGENESVVVTESNGYSHLFPGGFDYRSVLIAMPQISVEGILNSAASIRFISFNIDDEVGTFTTFGFAAEHHLSPYFDLENAILSVSAGYTTIKTGDLMRADQWQIMLTGGIDSEFFYGYAGLGYQDFTQTVRYEDVFAEGGENEIDIPASNHLLFQVGGGLQWSVIQAGLEVAPLAPTSVSLKLGLKL